MAAHLRQVGGIGATYLLNNYGDEISGGIKNMLGMGAQPPEMSALTPAEQTQLSQQLGCSNQHLRLFQRQVASCPKRR